MSRTNTIVEILTRENNYAFLMSSLVTQCSERCSVLLNAGSESDLMLLLDYVLSLFVCRSV